MTLASLIFYPILWLRGLALGVGRLISGAAALAAFVMTREITPLKVAFR